MTTATMTSKGQITIPVDIREQYGIQAGVNCLFVPIDEHRFEVYPKTGDAMDLYGKYYVEGVHATLEEMDQAVSDYLGEKNAPPSAKRAS